ncbi:hypothetical protein [Sorangium sp. Soce836]|uniref:hypothetical protein n=1 Tax=Sorangium sp. So ce836 TaxID=2969250 RepID=UPI00101A0E80|nr:hypothetical protein [Sorangium sp. Soce836]
MNDPHDLAALIDAVLADPVEVLELPHPTAPAVLLRLVYDEGGPLIASWRCGAWRHAVEVGEA